MPSHASFLSPRTPIRGLIQCIGTGKRVPFLLDPCHKRLQSRAAANRRLVAFAMLTSFFVRNRLRRTVLLLTNPAPHLSCVGAGLFNPADFENLNFFI